MQQFSFTNVFCYVGETHDKTVSKLTFSSDNSVQKAERCGSVGRVLDWGSKGCWFQPHRWWSHYVVSLSKALYPLLSTGSA